MLISSEPIGSLPRKPELIQAIEKAKNGEITQNQLLEIQTKEAISCMEASAKAGNKVVTDGEQFKVSFLAYPLVGCKDLSPNGPIIPFADGHQRQLPSFTGKKFKYSHYSKEYISRIIGSVPAGCVLKQAVISASAMSLLYPNDGISGYSREEFLNDVVNEVLTDIRGAFEAGAQIVQVDCTELRLSLLLDPSGGLLRDFINLNNRVFEQLTPDQLKRTGVHTCPGGDQDSTHSLDVDYDQLLQSLFNLRCQNFYLEFAAEKNHNRVLAEISTYLNTDQKIFIGVTDPINPMVETAEYVQNLVLIAARYIPSDRLGTCDDCGFSPFSDDQSTSIHCALAKMEARINGTKMASDVLGLK